MATELIVNASLPETRIALMEEGEIQELLIERATGKGIVGNIYKGRVTRVLPGMQAAFVDIGLEKAAFLYVDDVHVHSNIWAEEEGDDAENSEETNSEESQQEEASDQNDANPNESEDLEDSSNALDENALDASNEQDSSENDDLEEDEESQEQEESTGNIRPIAMSASEDRETLQTISEDFEESDSINEDSEDSENEQNNENSDLNHETKSSTESFLTSDVSLESTISSVSTGDAPLLKEEEKSLEPIFIGETEDGTPIFASATAPGVEAAPLPKRFIIGSNASGNIAPRNPNDSRNNQDKFKRGKRGGKGRFRRGKEENESSESNENVHESFQAQISEDGELQSDRSAFSGEAGPLEIRTNGASGSRRPEFKEQRGKDRKIKAKSSTRAPRVQVNIQDLLKEGQEVIVQIAKDPIATKGARLTCHISLPGRHLVCMPTIDHVGVSRRIEREDERRKLREYVDSHRPKKLGFIVRTATATGKQQSERRIKQDIDYLSKLWEDIRENAGNVTAPALVYEDLNPVLRAIRDWVNEDIDKITVDSKYHFNEVTRFVSHFMPSVKQKVELYAGDIPIFDAYGISTELARALERKVWLKSGGYIVVDQAEALVAIDVNTGRYVGKKSLEDTILKTNLEAVKEVAYQLRLRNCGGIIIIDLIDMDKEENKYRVYRALEEELKKDRARPQILKISELGLIEMTRKRTRDTIVRALCDSCAHCEGKGYIKSKQTVAYEILRDIEREGIDSNVMKILIQASPDVIDALAIDERESLDQLEKRYRKTVYLQAVTDFHPEQFEVIGEKRNEVKRSEEEILDRVRERSGSDLHRGNRGRRDQKNDRNGRNGKKGGSDRGGRNESRDTVEAAPRENRVKIGGGSPQNHVGIERNQDRHVERNAPKKEIDPESQINFGIKVNPQKSNPVEEIDYDERQPQFDAEGNVIRQNRGGNSQSSNGQNYGNGMQYDGADDEFMTEEDRIAFQRAQAAQDAAIANMTQAGNAATTITGRVGGFQKKNNGAPGRWGKNRNGGGAGKKHPRPSRFQGGFKRGGAPNGDGGPSSSNSND